MRTPRGLGAQPSWRHLYEAGAFAQRELIEADRFRSAAAERGLRLGMGKRALEDFDVAGALQPIAFADGGYSSGRAVPAEPVERLAFREELGSQPWSDYEWGSYGRYRTVSALYSPWLLLYLDDVLSGTAVDLPIEMLLGGEASRERGAKSLLPLVEDRTNAGADSTSIGVRL